MTDSKAIKELMNTIEDLQSQIDRLKKVVDDHQENYLPNLEERIEDLEKETGLDQD